MSQKFLAPSVLHASAAETASGQTDALPVKWAEYLEIFIDVTAIAAAGDISYFVEGRVNGGTWAAVVSEANVVATGVVTKAVQRGATAFGDEVRVRWVLNSGTGQTFSIVVGQRG